MLDFKMVYRAAIVNYKQKISHNIGYYVALYLGRAYAKR